HSVSCSDTRDQRDPGVGQRHAIGHLHDGRNIMPEPITRTILERFDVPDSNYETIMMLVEMAPRFNPGLHTHPGFDSAYLLEGSLTVIERGKPDKGTQAHQSWRVPPGSVPEGRCGDQNRTSHAV